MTQTLSPTPKQRFYDNNNIPAAGAQLFTYQAGTSTKLTTYKFASGTNNTNPIILDARGECDLWIPPNVAYKYVFAPSTDTDPPTNPFWSIDNVVNSQLITLYGGVDTGSVNAYVLTFTAQFTSYVDGTVIYWIASHTNTTSSTINVNGLGVVNIKNQDGSNTAPGQITAGQVIQIIYVTGQFLLLTNVIASGTFTGTLTGCTTSPTQLISYRITGNIVSLVFAGALSGTSNSTSMTITGLPTAIQTVGATSFPCMVTDNGVDRLGVASVNVGTIFFLNTSATGAASLTGFTAAGTKGVPAIFTLVYAR